MNIQELLKKNETKDLLRFLTCGSVDNGKSTMIGRLLHDSKEVYDDHLKTLKKDSRKVGSAGDTIDFSLLLDGLKAEREQGITIDVAYRYFSTPKRKFIIADCPGHEQYTRNMATGASTANLAVVLIDARDGVVKQTKRHSFIASLLGIGHIIVAINKMDLVDYSAEVYKKVQEDYKAFASRLEVRNIDFIPMSALLGDNIVERSPRMPWYQGMPLLEYLQTVHIASDRNLIDMRFPVQYVLRQDMNFRGYCGTIASGILRPGSDVKVLPSGKITKVKAIHNFEGTLEEAFPPMAVTITTEDEIDISRGDMLVSVNNQPRVSRRFDASVVWMSEIPLEVGRRYHIKQGSQQVDAEIAEIVYRIDINTIASEPAKEIKLNEIARLRIETGRSLTFDSYRRNRVTGSFILIDPISNATVAAGMILAQNSIEGAHEEEGGSQTQRPRVSVEERRTRLKQSPITLWLTGSLASRNSAIAYGLERHFFDKGFSVNVLEEEVLRHGLSQDLEFCASNLSEGVRRMAHVAKLYNEMGIFTIVVLTSPHLTGREAAKKIVGEGRFFEVQIADFGEAVGDDVLDEAENETASQRFVDVSSEVSAFPPKQTLRIDTDTTSVDQALQSIVDLLCEHNLFFS